MAEEKNGALALVVEDIGPIEGEANIGDVRYGLNELRGENQEGKTHTLLAVRQMPVRRLRRDAVAIHDGSESGSVSLGEHSLRLISSDDKFSAQRSGDGLAAVQEMPDPIDALVGAASIKGDEARLKKRLRSFCELLRLTGTPNRLEMLLDGVHLPSQDYERVTDLLDQAEVLAAPRGVLNAAGLETEREAKAKHTEAAEAQGVEKDLRKRIRDRGLDPNDPKSVPSDAEERMATDALVGLRGKLEAQRQLIEQRALIEAPEPDVASARKRLDAATEEADELLVKIEHHQKLLEEVKAQHYAAEARREAAAEAVEEIQNQHKSWQQQRDLLADAESDPVTQDDVDEATKGVELIRSQIATRSMFGEMKKAHTDYLEATEAAEELEAKAKRYRSSVGRVWANLGSIINQAVGDNSPVRVEQNETEDGGVESRIVVQVQDGSWRDVSDDGRVSKGRVRQAFLELFLTSTDLSEVTVWVDDLVMLPIGPEGRVKIHEMAAEKKIRLIFEQPAERGLRLFWWGDYQVPS